MRTCATFYKPACMLALLGLMTTSCMKEAKPDVPPDSTNQETDVSASADVSAAAVNANLSINWDSYAHGSQYTQTNANTDFGNMSGVNSSRTMISNGMLRITLLKNALSGAGGFIGNTNIDPGSAYEMDYDIRFHSQFDWSRGGKVGFGFGIGDANTGGDPAWDGNGGTLRLMWYQTDAGRVFFQPYIYYKDQPGQYGDTFGKSYPSSGSISKGTTYHVHMYIKSNTGSNTNGRVQIIINGTVVLDRDIRWTTNDSKRLIRQLTFHTFRGGSQSYWESTTDGYIYYDNLVVHKIN
jgi:hypothetical protein